MPNVQNRPTYTRTIRMRQKTREPGAQQIQGDGGIRELGGLGETGRTRVTTIRRIRKSEIRGIPRIPMWPTTSDGKKVLIFPF
jgi:hypothetical protein